MTPSLSTIAYIFYADMHNEHFGAFFGVLNGLSVLKFWSKKFFGDELIGEELVRIMRKTHIFYQKHNSFYQKQIFHSKTILFNQKNFFWFQSINEHIVQFKIYKICARKIEFFYDKNIHRKHSFFSSIKWSIAQTMHCLTKKKHKSDFYRRKFVSPIESHFYPTNKSFPC